MIAPPPDARAYFRGRLSLAPMATGGNLPYRRLCREFGADLTCSEMVIADKLVKRSRAELPLLRHHPAETDFGVQLCGKTPAVVAEAAARAAAAGARFIDLNFGCPIDLVVRRGAGAALLKHPARLAAVVAAVRRSVTLPLSVKIRAGYHEDRINAVENARAIADAGADAVVVHGRTREQHYRRAADWGVVAAVAAAVPLPVIGNGDILTHWDLEARAAASGAASVMIARGALIKPWIFRELRQGQAMRHDAAARWRVMKRYFDLAREHFGDDSLGLGRVERFFLWHLGFWHRYRPYTEDDFRAASPAPLIQHRDAPIAGDGDEALLASPDPADHRLIWERMVAGDHPAA